MLPPRRPNAQVERSDSSRSNSSSRSEDDPVPGPSQRSIPEENETGNPVQAMLNNRLLMGLLIIAALAIFVWREVFK